MIHRTLLLSVLSVLVALAPAGWAAEAAPSVKFPKGIPNHPEKLQFPPLQYEPPDPKEYRLQLAAGPVAYIAADRELPLVSLTILVRTGDYLEPPGKEGVTDLTGYLLAGGGTKSKKAEDLEERLAFLAANLNS